MSEKEKVIYVGSKVIFPEPMTRKEYNDFRNWEVPEDENPDDEGYLVEDCDGGESNVANREGYVSWSPKGVFDNSYQNARTGMSFSHALLLLKKGYSLARKGWNGKGMFIFKMNGSNGMARIAGYGFGEYLNEPTFRDCIIMRTANNELVPWTIAQSDALAEDWVIV